jgi:hypothetical protein
MFAQRIMKIFSQLLFFLVPKKWPDRIYLIFNLLFIKGSLCLTFNNPLAHFSSNQGHSESGRAEQHLTDDDTDAHVHGSRIPVDTSTKTAKISARKSRSAGGNCKGRKYGHLRMSTSIPQPTMELLDAQFPIAWQKSLRQNRWSGWVEFNPH